MSEGRVFIVDDRPNEIRTLEDPGAGPRTRVPPSPGMRGRWSTFPLMAGRSAGLDGAW